MSNFTEAVAQGIVPAPNTRLIKAQFTYNTGATLVLDDDSLAEWFSNYLRMIHTSFIVEAFQQQQQQQKEAAEAAPQQPIVPSEKVRDWLQTVENKQRGLPVDEKK